MSDVLGFANQLPMSIKLAWMFWLGWTLIQAGWFQRARVIAPVKPPQPQPPPVPRRKTERQPVGSSPYDVPRPPVAVSARPVQPATVLEVDTPQPLGEAAH